MSVQYCAIDRLRTRCLSLNRTLQKLNEQRQHILGGLLFCDRLEDREESLDVRRPRL